jgi:hypothetical protein
LVVEALEDRAVPSGLHHGSGGGSPAPAPCATGGTAYSSDVIVYQDANGCLQVALPDYA